MLRYRNQERTVSGVWQISGVLLCGYLFMFAPDLMDGFGCSNGGDCARRGGVYGNRTGGVGRNPRRRNSWRSGVIQVHSMKVKPAACAALPWDRDWST